MTQYIDKAALVAEIERRIKERDIQMKQGCWVSSTYMYEDLLDFLDTLEVKEVEEEPVSNDLEEASDNYVGHAPEIDEDLSCFIRRNAFIAGAQWQKERLMENAVEAVIHPYDGEIWVDKDLLSIYDDCQRVKLIIIKENKL